MGFVRNRDQYASVRGGFLSLFPAAYGVHGPADAPARFSGLTYFFFCDTPERRGV